MGEKDVLVKESYSYLGNSQDEAQSGSNLFDKTPQKLMIFDQPGRQNHHRAKTISPTSGPLWERNLWGISKGFVEENGVRMKKSYSRLKNSCELARSGSNLFEKRL